MRFLLYVLPVVLIVAVAAMFGLLLSSPRDPKLVPSVLIDKPAPAFRLPNLMGGRDVTEADLRNPGGVTLFNVFASWCIPCRAENPVLQAAARDPKVRMVGLDYKDKAADVKDWLKKSGNPYALIAADTKGRVAIDYGVYGVPETFIINDKGRIVFKFTGPLDINTYQNTVEPLIAKLTR